MSHVPPTLLLNASPRASNRATSVGDRGKKNQRPKRERFAMARNKASTSDAARERHAKLAAEIEEHRRRYYLADAPTISDDEYDGLERELRKIESTFPDLVDAESPTTTVGGLRSEMFEPVEHLERMYSLDNAFTDEELRAWVTRVEAGLPKFPPMLCELKVDGLAVDLVYRDGSLASLATR